MFETDYRKEAIEYLANSIKANNAVAFIGSGLSQLAGVKSWMQLLEDLKSRLHANAAIISAIGKAIEQGRFLNAATMIREIMEDDRFEKEIQSLIDDTTEPQPEHKVLMELGFRAVITTNYDTLLERSLERIDSLSYYESSDISKFIHDRRPFIFHLHGIINRPGKIILDWSKYNELLVPNLSIRFLGTLLETSEILWIGYSHSDPDLNLVMAQQSYLRLPGGYQLVFEDDYELAIMCKNRGIKPVRISRTDRNNDVLCFLRELQDKIGSLREREDADLLNAYSTIITDSFSGLIPKLPPKILNLNVLQEDGSELAVTRNEKEVEEGKILLFTQLFEQWIEPSRGGPGRKIAIVASPGVGKTVLLSLFAKWLRDAPEFPIKPVVLFLRAASLEDIEINKTELMNRIHENIKRPKSSPYSPEAIQGKFEELREKGLVYLLFDGLDEFGAGRPGELKNLMTSLRKLAENMHVNILITCRKVFWRSQVAKENIEEEVWTKIQIRSIAEKRMNTLLPDPPFGDFAYNDGDKRKGLRLGFRNYLIWSFVEELGGPGCGQEFGSRWQLFGDWSQRQAQEAQEETGIRSDDWMAFFQETALELLRKEEPSVYPPKLKDGLVLPFEQCCKTRIIRPSGDRENRKIRFFQESVKEFFTANALADSFCELLEGICKGETLDDLPLAEVDQDFLQPSIYGFLYEILREKHGEDHIVSIIKNLKICVLKKLNKRLLRNVVEYIGMTYRQRGSVDPNSEKENYESIVYWLLDIIGEPELVDQCASEPDHDYVRYNAARALERIHPWAPHPYFDYMSDWGDRDWGDIHKEASNEGLRPWAIRWRGSTYPKSPERRRTLGQHPSLAICKSPKINLCLQKCVSNKLINAIDKLLEEPERNRYLLINCSYALVRWYIEDHSEKLAKLRSKAGELFETRAQNPVYDNVFNWVGRPQFNVKT